MGGDRLLATFLDLARIASPSFRESDVARYCIAALEAAGCDVRVDDSAAKTGSDTGNVIAVLPGTCDGLSLVLSAHMDTVEPAEGVEPLIEGGTVRSAGNTVLGADDKAGVAVILETVRRLSESGEPHVKVRVVLTVAEERGLVGAKALDPADVRGDLCLVLDADGEPGGIVVGSPTHYTFAATFIGRAAHAGVEPEKGISATSMAAHAICAMPTGRLDEQTTANVGRIEGGVATNVVSPIAEVSGECRSRDPERVEAVRADMQAAMEKAASDAGGKVEVIWTKEYDAVRFEEGDQRLAIVESACRDAGLEPRRVVTGGGSDANVLYFKGVPSIALASGIRDCHTVDESLEIVHLGELTALVLAVLERARD